MAIGFITILMLGRLGKLQLAAAALSKYDSIKTALDSFRV